MFIIPTTQAILVGEVSLPHPCDCTAHTQYEGTPAGDGNVVVSKLADYLKSVGY